MKKISQAEARRLLELSAELVVTLLSNGYALRNTLRDADTGELVPGKTSFSELQDHILLLRKKLKS